MKRLLFAPALLAVIAVAHPALAQDDWDDDSEFSDDEFGDDADEFGDDASAEASFDADTNTTTASATVDAGAPVGMAPAQLGIGFRATISGAVGPEVEYWMSDKLLLTGGLALQFNSPPGDDADSSLRLAVSGGGFLQLASGDRAMLLGGGRLVVGYTSRPGDLVGDADSALQFNVEVPLRTEVFLSRILSFHLETGLAISITSEDGSALGGEPPDATVISLGANRGLFGAAGITLYWP